MRTADATAGWAWFDAAGDVAAPVDEVCRSAAACLSNSNGQVLLRHLERAFRDRRIPPTASDAELRHAEGQRSVVDHLMHLVERGRVKPTDITTALPKTGVSP
jgi:hypothetical protein